ncbi:MAG TPA: ribosome maturation factor RimM [Saprospiraceae bacterium]|nr:ribosome maturation factor RimM [Saprospiraceae bacterium]HPI06033.1 ribosome maturation factor RimM [Saprospiraceae bacterium]
MAENPYVLIGHTRKAHGLTGELKLHIDERYLEDFLKNERIFLDVKGTKIPYFVANVRGKGEMILLLEDVSDRDAATMLQGREVFLREKDLLPDEERELEYVEEVLEYEHLTGFMLIDQTLGEIGIIGEVLEMPQQEMAFLKYQGREVLVPLNEQLIVEVDEAGKKVIMDLPGGLLD